MPQLNSDELQAAIRLARDIDNSDAGSLLAIEQLLRGVCRLIAADAAAWNLAAPTAQIPVNALVYVGWDSAKSAPDANEYLRKDLADNPVIRSAIKSVLAHGRPVAVSRAQAVDARRWRASDFACTTAKKLAFDDVIVSAVPISGQLISLLHLYRSRGSAKPYSRADCAAVHPLHEQLLAMLRCDLPQRRGSDAWYRQITQLSPKRKLTLQLLLSGDSEKQIAAKLRRSRHTIHMHVKAVYRAFDVSSRAQLLSRAAGGRPHSHHP